MESITPQELYRLAQIVPSGSTRWGDKIPSKASGVYVISVESTDTIAFIEPFEQIERKNWREGQEIIYIGRATVLETRLKQFYKHIYGQPSPHRGGQAILLLDCPKTITWAEVQDFGGAEDCLIKLFQEHAGHMPFGNRVRSAKMRSDENRFVADKSDIQLVGKHKKTINHLSPGDEAANREHDNIVTRLFGKDST